MAAIYQRALRATSCALAVLLIARENVHALTPNNVLPTSAVLNNGLQHDIIPRPTAPPRGFELRIRQQDPLATCGFIDGASGE